MPLYVDTAPARFGAVKTRGYAESAMAIAKRRAQPLAGEARRKQLARGFGGFGFGDDGSGVSDGSDGSSFNAVTGQTDSGGAEGDYSYGTSPALDPAVASKLNDFASAAFNKLVALVSLIPVSGATGGLAVAAISSIVDSPSAQSALSSLAQQASDAAARATGPVANSLNALANAANQAIDVFNTAVNTGAAASKDALIQLQAVLHNVASIPVSLSAIAAWVPWLVAGVGLVGLAGVGWLVFKGTKADTHRLRELAEGFALA